MRTAIAIPLVLSLIGCVPVETFRTSPPPSVSSAPVTSESAAAAVPPAPPDARALAVWKEFVAEVRSGEWPDQRFLLYPETNVSTDQLRKWLRDFRNDPSWLKQLDAEPRAYRIAPHIHFLVPRIRSNGERDEYLFTIVDEGGAWYFRIMETLQLPIYSVPALPAKSFPHLSKSSLDWRRAEGLTTKDVILWNNIKKEKGVEAALRSFIDGYGYRMQVQTWLPYFPTHIGFVLYACWEQTDIWGNEVVLQELDDSHAVILFTRSLHFALYERTGHLRQMISREDYLKIFETIWSDRAEKGGWNVSFRYGPEPERAELRFARRNEPSKLPPSPVSHAPVKRRADSTLVPLRD